MTAAEAVALLALSAVEGYFCATVTFRKADPDHK